ncbi:fungal-specific transcription factor domain-containing protein [Calycina marina]|uniref:Fungal-specific transcription factor domain-containing protein n=1 Tax=Calycina marina TaxID=1763456 RepID=A0A9P7ZC09_9HELO|nr:fungal-specific transcription factor domain-containing protein [Calycina marina]
MPGILPMKVIKVGISAQSRIAQACDRCRSKKIRCDGTRPCCSQCANVGFECKTSDKLSRRAFPRGYTESLEERVRALEAEVRELKDLLDEKDEKIDMLSRIHSNIGDHARRYPSTNAVCQPSQLAKEIKSTSPKEDIFRVQASPLFLSSDTSDLLFMGASSGRAFVDAFNRKVQESGKSLAGLNTEAFLNVKSKMPLPCTIKSTKTSSAPPRMFSDRCVNVYFQEWAPLFPVLHKPTFLSLYEEYMINSDRVVDLHNLAQLHLVFGIAGLSSDTQDQENIASCERQWRTSLQNILMENTLGTLQCLVLAILYCITKSDYTSLQYYKGIAVGLSHRLGLHQSQKHFSFGALTTETRKKVFWTLYTVDCFSAAAMGLPKLLKEEDLHAEYPSDADDGCITERGFQPSIPGDVTRMSNALAMFRAARIMSKVLDQVYSAAATHDLSLQTLTILENELTAWSDSLPPHLKLTFRQEKPSIDLTGSRSAILSLVFYYIRSLIHRPAIGSSLGSKASASTISLADSSKHIIQIVQLLEERNMSFSVCLNKNKLLTLCGLSLLYQGLDLKHEGKLMQDGQRLIGAVVIYLEKANAPRATDFKRLTAIMLNQETLHYVGSQLASPQADKSTSISRKPVPSKIYGHSRISESDLPYQKEKLRRATLPNLSTQTQSGYQYGRSSFDAMTARPVMSRHDYEAFSSQLPARSKPHLVKVVKPPNLDYLSLNSAPSYTRTSTRSSAHTRPQQRIPTPNPPQQVHKTPTATASEWEVLVGSFDDRHLYDAIYGGGPTSTNLPDTVTPNLGDWSTERDYAPLGIHILGSTAAGATSVFSLSDENLSSGDDLSASELGLSVAELKPMSSGGNSSICGDGLDYLLEGLDQTQAIFGL